MKLKPVLPFVETMITQACNISCTGCTNYSDLVHSGYLTWQQGREQIEPWLERVTIPDFGILGGEPLMNPDVRSWIRGLRDLMPDAQIRFTTNGLLLDRNFDVVDLLADIGNCVFKVAVHVNDSALEHTIDRVLKRYRWEPVTEHGVNRLRTGNGFRFHIRRPDVFYKTFRGAYEDMLPHNNEPAAAFANCCQQTCPLLYNGKIYKCSTAGLLEPTLERFRNPNLEQWQPYIDSGLAPDCTEHELEQFLTNFGKPSTICRQCPTKQDTESVLIHLENVSRKKRTSSNH